jgi:hypothetical protein
MDGVFSVDELIQTFENFFFNRMILDITAIEDYNNLANLQKLSINLDMSKVILLLDDNPESDTKGYLSKLISMGIYNFTKNIAGINYLMQHPNSYRDVAHLHNLQNIPEENNETPPPVIIGEHIYVENAEQKLNILGIKSITKHPGATTLTYLMKKHLSHNYSVSAVEVDKGDFIYFPEDKDLITTTADNLPKEILKLQSCDIILVDLNDYDDDGICTEVLYLIEPSLIMMNRLSKTKLNIFEKLRGKKIVLINSMLSQNEISEFEFETKLNVFYNLPPVNDRKENIESIKTLLNKLGYVKEYE